MFGWQSTPVKDAIKACASLQELPDWPLLNNEKPFEGVKQLGDKKCVIVTNIASNCGLTEGHYTEFEELYKRFAPNLEILAFPSNDFKEEKNDSCSRERRKQLTFPIFGEVHVNGPEAHDIFTWCKWKSGKFTSGSSVSYIGWNFGKFLISEGGTKVEYVGPRSSPKTMEKRLEELIGVSAQ